MAEPGTSRGKGCLGFLAFCAVAGIVAGLMFTLWRRAQDDDLRARWKARGLPTSLAELDAWYEHVPDEANAALLFMDAATNLVPTRNELEERLPIVGSTQTSGDEMKLDEETLKTAKDYLDANKEILASAHAAAKLPESRYPVDFTTFPLVDLECVTQNIGVIRILLLESRVRGQSGDTDGAIYAYKAALTCAQTMSKVPSLSAHLTAVGAYLMITNEIAKALSTHSYTDSQLREIHQSVADISLSESLTGGLIGDSVFSLFVDSPVNGLRSPWGVFDHREYLRFVEGSLDAATAPWPMMVSKFEALEFDGTSTLEFYTEPLSQILLPAFSRTYISTVRGLIHRDLLVLVVAIERFRLHKGGLPDDLSSLVPDFLLTLAQDPYAEREYLYIREGTGYVVYSLGPDGADDNGSPMSGPFDGDISIRIPK